AVDRDAVTLDLRVQRSVLNAQQPSRAQLISARLLQRGQDEMGFKAANGFRKSWLLAAPRWSQAPERFEFVQKSQRHFFQRVEPAIKGHFVQQSPGVNSNRRRNIFCSPNRGTHSCLLKLFIPLSLWEKVTERVYL